MMETCVAVKSRAFRLTALDAPEQVIQGSILRYLQREPRVAWAARFNSGAHLVQGTDASGRPTRRWIRYAFAGCSDILGQLTSGHLMAIECKSASGRLTEDQTAFLARVRAANGLAIVARSIDDVRLALDAFEG